LRDLEIKELAALIAQEKSQWFLHAMPSCDLGKVKIRRK
jgi:hypothetical protein